MKNSAPAEMRAALVAALTADERNAWTCTSDRLIVRRGGRTLCKIGVTKTHLIVDVVPPSDVPPEIAKLLSKEAPKDAQGTDWRRAEVRTAEELAALGAFFAIVP